VWLVDFRGGYVLVNIKAHSCRLGDPCAADSDFGFGARNIHFL